MSTVAITQNKDIEKAVTEAISLIGGLDRIIHKGDKVLVKPNFCEPASPLSGVITNYKVVESIANEILKVGGIPIIGESCINSSPENTQRAIEASGIMEIAEQLGIRVVNFDKDEIVDVNIPAGKAIKQFPTARTVLDCNVRISVPVLKYHMFTKVTLGLKNMKGCLIGRAKGDCHYYGLHQSIVDYNMIIKPDLVIIDGTVAGAWHTSRNPVRLNLIVAGFDPVATDAVGSFILGVNPKEIKYLKYASEAGLGILDLDKIEIKGKKLEEVALK